MTYRQAAGASGITYGTFGSRAAATGSGALRIPTDNGPITLDANTPSNQWRPLLLTRLGTEPPSAGSYTQFGSPAAFGSNFGRATILATGSNSGNRQGAHSAYSTASPLSTVRPIFECCFVPTMHYTNQFTSFGILLFKTSTSEAVLFEVIIEQSTLPVAYARVGSNVGLTGTGFSLFTNGGTGKREVPIGNLNWLMFFYDGSNIRGMWSSNGMDYITVGNALASTIWAAAGVPDRCGFYTNDGSQIQTSQISIFSQFQPP